MKGAERDLVLTGTAKLYEFRGNIADACPAFYLFNYMFRNTHGAASSTGVVAGSSKLISTSNFGWGLCLFSGREKVKGAWQIDISGLVPRKRKPPDLSTFFGL